MGATLHIASYDLPRDTTLNGLPSQLVDIPAVNPTHGADHEGVFTEIAVPQDFPPGSIMLFETQLEDYDADLEMLCRSGVQEMLAELSLVDLNVLLYRADSEERDATCGEFGVYSVPGLGDAVYCGLEGWMHYLKHIMRYNDLGHPLCAHLRDGSWALDYVYSRLFRCLP